MRFFDVIRAGAWLPLSLWAVLHEKAAADGYDAEARELEHVQVTATRRAMRDFDVSAAVTQVDDVSIRAEAPDVLAEILRGLPGTFFQQTTPGQGIPIIRGLKGSQVLHLVDGIRLNNAFFRDAPNQYLGLVDSFAVERVEVVRGAAGSLYGADAMGGVVNVLTPQPRFEGNQWQWGGTVYGAFSSADKGWIGRAETEAGRDGMSFAGGATWQDRGDRRVGGGGQIHPSAYRSEAVDLKFISDVGARGEIMLSAQVLEQPRTPRVDELVPGYDQGEPSSQRYDFEPNRRDFLHARYRLRGGSHWFEQVEINLARQAITDDRTSQEFGITERVRENNESVLDGLTLQFDSTLAGGHLLTWGGEYYRDKVTSSRIRRETSSGQEDVIRSRFPDGSTMDSIAVFARADWSLPGRLSLGTGLRYSAFDIRLPASDALPAVRLSPSDLTGDLNLLFALTEELHLVANVGRGFRPPNIFDLAALGPRPGNRFNIPNPDLGPESVWSYDAGLKIYQGDWEFEVFGFYLDYRDKITSVNTGDVTPLGRTVVRGENRNRMVIYGIESGARWSVTENFEMYGVLNYTRGEERGEAGATDNGDRIPPLNGRLGIRYWPASRWSVEAYWSFAGAQNRLSERDIGDPRIDPEGTAGWGTLNLLASWQASDFITLGLKLENPGDVRYREHGSGIDSPGRNLGLWFDATW
jgi:outer membrane receptor protein involved in Fe transport